MSKIDTEVRPENAECVITESAAQWILSSVSSTHTSTSYRPNAPRKQRCVVLRSTGSHGGVHDMEVIATAEWWHKAVAKAILAAPPAPKEKQS